MTESNSPPPDEIDMNDIETILQNFDFNKDEMNRIQRCLGNFHTFNMWSCDSMQI